MINFNESVVGIWFSPIGGIGDFLAALSVTEGKSTLQYRFRYYSGAQVGDPFKDDDTKNWYTMETDKDPPESIINVVRKLMAMAPADKADKYELLRGDQPFKQFMNAFMELPFVHAKEVN